MPYKPSSPDFTRKSCLQRLKEKTPPRTPHHAYAYRFLNLGGGLWVSPLSPDITLYPTSLPSWLETYNCICPLINMPQQIQSKNSLKCQKYYLKQLFKKPMLHLDQSHVWPAPLAQFGQNPAQKGTKTLKGNTSGQTGNNSININWLIIKGWVTCGEDSSEERGVIIFMRDLWTFPLVCPTWHSNSLWLISLSSSSTSFFYWKANST